jgi:hypothetical protein
MEPIVEADERSGPERLQVEGLVVQHFLGGWVGCQQDLEPSVKKEAIDFVGAYATANPVGRLKNRARDALLMESPRTR